MAIGNQKLWYAKKIPIPTKSVFGISVPNFLVFSSVYVLDTDKIFSTAIKMQRSSLTEKLTDFRKLTQLLRVAEYQRY